MNILRGLIIIIALAAAAGAQQTKNASAPQGKKVEAARRETNQAKQLPPDRSELKQTPPAKTKSAESDQEEEEGSVMVDTKAEGDSSAPDSDSRGASEETNNSAGIPASYGQLKGTLNESGRGFMVFETEEGIISLVQVIIGKPQISWKLISKFHRSAD